MSNIITVADNETIVATDIMVVKDSALPSGLRVTDELFNSWISYIDASKKTVETYSKAIKGFRSYIEERNIQKPQRDDIVAYREYLKRDHKPTTVQLYIAAVKLFFQWTDAQTGINHYDNIADHIKGAKIDNAHKKDYLTSRQVIELLNSIDRSTLKGLRDYAILSLMVTTGLRTVSVMDADIRDIRTAGDDIVLYYRGKGHEEKAEYVKLAEPVEKAIRAYLKARGKVDSSAPLFGSIANRNNGGRMTTRSISRVAKEHFRGIDLDSERITAHSLRHTAATLNLLNGASVEETQQLLGHANINTTLIYSHALERAKNNSEKRIADAIFG